MAWFHFYATNQEIFECLQKIDWSQLEGNVKKEGHIEPLPLTELFRTIENGECFGFAVRQKTGKPFDPRERVQGRFEGFISFQLPSDLGSEIVSPGAVGYDDKYLEPGFPLAKPVHTMFVKQMKTICNIRLCKADPEQWLYKCFCTPTYVELLRSGRMLGQSPKALYALCDKEPETNS